MNAPLMHLARFILPTARTHLVLCNVDAYCFQWPLREPAAFSGLTLTSVDLFCNRCGHQAHDSIAFAVNGSCKAHHLENNLEIGTDALPMREASSTWESPCTSGLSGLSAVSWLYDSSWVLNGAILCSPVIVDSEPCGFDGLMLRLGRIVGLPWSSSGEKCRLSLLS